MHKLCKLGAILGLLFNSSAYANSELCYPLVHGENGLGSTNAMYLPNLYTSGANWYSTIHVTNAGYQPVNVKLEFFNFDGSAYFPYDTVSNAQFSGENSPINLNSGGAILRPNQTGLIIIHDSALDHAKGMIGKVSWQADSCLDKAIVVNVRTVYSSGHGYDQGLVFLNGGNPF